jgi:hypothetical protein
MPFSPFAGCGKCWKKCRPSCKNGMEQVCCNRQCCRSYYKEKHPKNGENKWKQRLPIGDDISGYSIQIIDNVILRYGEPRDWLANNSKKEDFLDSVNNYVDEIKDITDKLDGCVNATRDKFTGVIGSYIDMLNQVGLFTTLVIGFGMGPVSGFVAEDYTDNLMTAFIWTSFITVFSSGWCVLECVFLAIRLNVLSSTLITGTSQSKQRALQLKQLKGINKTWSGIMIMFFISMGTFITQSVCQFVMSLDTDPGTSNITETRSVGITGQTIHKIIQDNDLLATPKDDGRNTIGWWMIGLTIAFGTLLLWRCTTKYVQYTSTSILKISTSIICWLPRGCVCYWPKSTKLDDPLQRLNYEYEFAVKKLQYVVDEAHHDTRQVFASILSFHNVDKFKSRLTLVKLRNLELFLLQIQEGHIRATIREGKYTDLISNKSSDLEKIQNKQFGQKNSGDQSTLHKRRKIDF